MHVTALTRRLNKPYFAFRPGQVVRRLRTRVGGDDGAAAGDPYVDVTLPWGLPIRIRRHEQIGVEIQRRGLFDLTVSETLHRLVAPGELALDAGGNFGHMTSVLAHRLGPRGEVLVFEPHPTIGDDLAHNVAAWTALPGMPRITIHRTALGEYDGVAHLAMTSHFDWNQGSATLEAPDERDDDVRVEEVPVRRLDDLLGDRTAGVMKIDVEGHELGVLRGATRALAEHRIRDIVFEEVRQPPTPVTDELERHGYTVLSLDHGLLGLDVGPSSRPACVRSGNDPSYVATVDPERALARLGRRGWGTLGVGPYRR